jgi:hypothetical protein
VVQVAEETGRGIAVGKRGQEGSDGLLTASEILDLKLLPSRQKNIYTVLETKCDFLPSV